jgi:predicted nucleotidyltransferase
LPLLGGYGASNLRLFGSVALGLEQHDLDLDLLVDWEPQQSLLAMIGLRHEWEGLFGWAVDVPEAETQAETLHSLFFPDVSGPAVSL